MAEKADSAGVTADE
ncbi:MULTISPECIES: hypothetical protein [unclassified Escherichia]|nr:MULTISPECIES: hypothetical protein [unclassified Escherichia]